MRAEQREAPGPDARAQKAVLFVALIVGLLIGLLLVSRIYARNNQGPAVSQEQFVVLASTLYSEGEPLAAIDQYLAVLGKNDHASFVLQLADRYGKSDDQSKRRQAMDLRRLGQALQRGVTQAAVPAVVPFAKTVTPIATPITTTQASALPPSYGVVKSPQGDGVRLRVEAKTTSPALALLPNGTRVEILNVVEGQEIDRGEKRWYKVRNAQTVGYVYFPLVVPPD